MNNKLDRHLAAWIGVVFLLFPVLILAGIYMRSVQGNQLVATEAWFYPVMTLHGVGMVGLWYVGAMACAADVLRRHVKPSARVGTLALAGTVLGVALLLVAVLAGRFGAGWYFLYPLPFQGEWPAWSAVVFLVSLTILGATWLIWTLDLLRAIAARFPLSQALGWHYLTGKGEPALPPVVLISTVSLICSVAALAAAVMVIVMFFLEQANGTAIDPLLIKNLTFFFGHTLINLAMYLGVGVVYEVLPEYAGRPWKTNQVVVVAWNAVLLIVLLAYFHHLYMDFAQPESLQYLGQVASYASSIPSAVVTLFGALLLLWHSRMRWNLTSMLFVLGLVGWASGGLGALIDSTVVVNFRLHNTLWVPAHFHTYLVAGLVFLVVGYFYHACQAAAPRPEHAARQRGVALLLMIGAYGFLMMFYTAGAHSVPRRFASYPPELAHGATYALIGMGFAAIYLAGFLLFLGEAGPRWARAWRGAPD